MARRKKKLAQPDTELDLTPMIDVIFLLIIFFILAGRITADISNQTIVVPPTKTAEKWDNQGWEHVKIEVRGNTQEGPAGGTPWHEIKFGILEPWVASGATDDEGAFDAYKKLRRALDDVYARADKYNDPKTKIPLPKVVLELRADADTEYRVVQEIQQIATDSIDPGNKMKPKDHSKNPAGMKAFVNFQFTTRLPGE